MNPSDSHKIYPAKKHLASKSTVNIMSVKNDLYWHTTKAKNPILADSQNIDDGQRGLCEFLFNEDNTISGYDQFANTHLCILDEDGALILADDSYTGDIPTFTKQSSSNAVRFSIDGQHGVYLGLFPGSRIKKSTTLDDSTLWVITPAT